MCAESVNSPGSVGYGSAEQVYNTSVTIHTSARTSSRIIHKASVEVFITFSQVYITFRCIMCNVRSAPARPKAARCARRGRLIGKAESGQMKGQASGTL